MIVLCYSGGIDSTVLLYELRHQGHEVRAVGFDYGQTHVRELSAAYAITKQLGVEFITVDLPTIWGSSLTDGTGGVVVPNRNMIMIAMAGSLAMAAGAEAVAIACHRGDHALFPDCRPRFLDPTAEALMAATGRRVRLLRPFTHWSKLEIIQRGLQLGVPFERTWSCYEGGTEPCGECLACRERREALLVGGAVPA